LEIAETTKQANDLQKSISEIGQKVALFETEQMNESKELAEMAEQLKLAREAADAMARSLPN
jgi:hypothetical protein